jgi:type VI secretion system protein ImpA
MIDLEALTVPVPGDDAGGVDCEYDDLYMEMDGLASTVAESQIGDSTLEGRDPDYKQLSKNCYELWEKTRDLRVAAYLVISEVCLGAGSNGGGIDSLLELNKGFKLLSWLINEEWDAFWPRLDPDDDNDPTERINILAMLSPEDGAMNDPVDFINHFRHTRLIPSLNYTVRDLLIANKELTVEGQSLDPSLLRAELGNLGQDALKERAGLVQETLDLVKDFCKAMNDKMGSGFVVVMDTLIKEVQRLVKFFDGLVSASTDTQDVQASADSVSPATPGGQVSAQAASSFSLSGNPAGRNDALQLLQKAADYFRRYEPTNPASLLIDRAIRVAGLDFISLLQEIVPDAVGKGREILGVKEGQAPAALPLSSAPSPLAPAPQPAPQESGGSSDGWLS